MSCHYIPMPSATASKATVGQQFSNMSAGGVREGKEAKGSEHKVEEMVATGEKEIAGEGRQVMQEGARGTQFLAQAVMHEGGQGEDGREQASAALAHHEESRERGVAVPKIGCERRAVGLADRMVFLLDFPA